MIWSPSFAGQPATAGTTLTGECLKFPEVSESDSRSDGRQLLLWGGTVGFGLGAIVDVVLFHLVLQHHHLLSGYIDPHSYEGLRENVMYDGLFLTLMFGVLFLGQIMV